MLITFIATKLKVRHIKIEMQGINHVVVCVQLIPIK